MRRLLTFLAMVAVGLAAVLLLSDDELESSAGGEALTGHADGGTAAVAIASDKDDENYRVQVGQTDFPIMRMVEVAPGEFREKLAYTLHVDRARVGEDGRYIIDGPLITLYDPPTGEWRGELKATFGSVETGQAAVGDVQLAFNNLQAESFSLEQDVRGRFATPEGEAYMEAELLTLVGQVVIAEGPVRWWRDDLSLAGVDMVLDDEAGTLDLDHDAVLTTGGRVGPAAVVHSPDGLLWNLPREGGGRGHGELRGPVTGEGEDGSRFSCALLLVDADTTAFTLLGDAWASLPDSWEARGEQLSVAPDASGRLSLEHGLDARVEFTQPGRERWLESALLQRDGDDLVSTVPVSFGVGGLAGRAADLRWDGLDGTLTCLADVTLRGESGSLAGATLDALGGMTLNLPPDAPDAMAAATGELRGPITGSLPDGGSFESERVELDGPGNGLTLVGAARIRRADGSEFLGQRLTLLADERGQLVDASGRGDVTFLGVPADERLELRSEQLHLTGGVISSPVEVAVVQGGLSLEGLGLTFTDATGVLDITRDAQLRRLDPGGSGVSHELDSGAGLSWTLPADRSLGPGAGRGVLRGPVSGHTSDGRSLHAQRARIDGPAGTLRLEGAARMEREGERPDWLQGEALGLRDVDGVHSLWSEVEVQFALGQLSGSALGLDYDEATRRLDLHRDTRLTVLDDAGRRRLGLTSRGPLFWVTPAEGDALLMGHGEAREQVAAVDDAGARFETDHLVMDGPTRTITLLGPSRMESLALDRRVELTAVEHIVSRRDEAGALTWLEALGRAHGELHAPDELLTMDASRVSADLSTDALVIDGPLHLVRDVDGDLSTVDGGPESRLVALAEPTLGLRSLVGSGGVTIGVGSFTATSDSLDWDLPADHVVLDGHCRLRGLAGRVDAPTIELWPEARRYHVPVPEVAIEDGP